jgi:hypothetical protein
VAEVALSDLRPACDPSSFPFETTADVQPHFGLIGQDRAIEALKFGLSIESKGFNVVVSGEPGTGRTTAIREYLQQVSAGKAPPDEWLYVNNFADPHQPRAIRMPPGKGREFQRQMADMINEARDLIPRTFESDDYVERRAQVVGSVERQRAALFTDLAERARRAGFQLQGNPSGFFLVPLAGDQPMDDQSFMALTQAQRDELLRRRDELMEQLRPLARQGQLAETEATKRLAELERTVAHNIVDALVARFFEDYAENGDVLQYVSELSRDMIDNVEIFLRPAAMPPVPGLAPVPQPIVSPFRKYEVNLLVDCSAE